MASFWFYILISAGAILGGLIIGIFLGWLYHTLRIRTLKKNCPKLDDLRMANPGNIKKDIKEVEEKDKHEYSKFREFERLRRLTINENTTARNAGISKSFKGDATAIRREILQNENINFDRKFSNPTARNYATDREIEQPSRETSKSTQFTRPEFL